MENSQPTVNKGGRPKGSTNKSAAATRAAIARFADHSAPHLIEWLSSVAYGIPKVNERGEPLRDPQGSVMYVNKPDPLGAIKAVEGLLDYHLPRLQRSDVEVVARVEHGGTLTDEAVRKMSLTEIKQRLLQSTGGGVDIFDSVTIDDPLAEPVDVVARMVPTEAHPEPSNPSGTPEVPEWLRGQE